MTNELYLVKISYRQANGYWKWGDTLPILVPLSDEDEEKVSHAKAEEITKDLYPACIIHSVSYA